MIKKQEINLIDKKYFNIIQYNSFVIYIQSKNTKHFWGIHLAEYPTYRNFKVYHKHNHYNEYHRHKDAKNIPTAIKHIQDHDKFQLKGRKK